MLNVYKFLGLVCLATYLSLWQTYGQEVCTPLGVVNVSISYDAVVSWDPHPDESCNISYYLIEIDSDVGTEYTYAVSRTYLSVSFLPVCDDYIFRIVPVTSENIAGEKISLGAKIPLPADANLTVGIVMVSQGEGQWIHMKWSMDDQWIKCADRFRIVVYDQEADHIQDIYTFNTSVSIPNLSPCTSYEFGVVAIYNWEIEGPITVVEHTTPGAVLPAPRLRDLTLLQTSANLTWTVEDYVFNKCPISRAEVTVLNNYNLTVDILDQTVRQPFNVVLPNLQSQNIYLVNITVINSAGPSRPTVVAIQTI